MDSAQSLQGDGFSVHVGQHGALEVRRGAECCRIESSYSYPGERIGRNWLCVDERRGESQWFPEVAAPGVNENRIRAAGQFYTLARTVSIAGTRVKLKETLKSTAAEPVGVLIRHRLLTSPTPTRTLLAGSPAKSIHSTPENPTALASLPHSHLGVLAEDTLSRVQFEAVASDDGTGISLEHVAIRPGASHTFRWALYPLDAEADYFTFINRIRRDWGSNFRVTGPFEFGPPPSVCEVAGKLKAYLQRKHVAIAAPGRWLDYDNYDPATRSLETRDQYRTRMRKTTSALRAADPEIRVVGNLEGPFASLSVELSRKLWEVLPPDQRGQYYPKKFTERQLELMGGLPIRQKDSLLYGEDAKPFYELYYRGPKDDRTPVIAMLVYPARGNQQMAIWMDQARFLMEDVGLDGVYLDGGAPVSGGRYGYDKWDGVTVDIDGATGRIVRRKTDFMRVIGDEPCRRLFDYVRSRGGAVVANGHHYTEQIQSYPIPRILETGGLYDPLQIGQGEERGASS